jgi:hypothetical protein
MRQAWALMRSKQAIALALLVAAALAGCGESQSKRAVDARTEVLRFYSVDSPVVAVLPGNPSAAMADFDTSVPTLPAWERLRTAAVAPLHAAGLGGSGLAQLVRTHDRIAGVDAVALAVGAPTPEDLTAATPLLVFATDQSDLLADRFREFVRAGNLRAAGKVDDAQLYRNADAAYAVRDGVLVSAPRLSEVRTAIERRDGDSDRQLDEDVVRSIFDKPGIAGPLLVYADLRRAREADPGLDALAAQLPWLAAAGQAAAAARPVGNALHLDAVLRMESNVDPAGQPFATASPSFSIADSDLSALGSQPGDPLRTLIAGLAPVSGTGTSSSEEVRLRADVSP